MNSIDTPIFDCLLKRASSLWPGGRAISRGAEGDVLTFRELDEAVLTASSRLERDLCVGDRVACLLDNSISSLITILALQRIGCVPALLNLRLSEKDWQEQYLHINARMAICSHPLQLPLEKWLRTEELEGAGASAERGLKREREALILFTSGSRGAPKAARLTYQNLLSSAYQSNMNTGLSPGDRWLLSLPIYHAGGLCILYRCLLAGAELQLMEGFDREEIVKQSVKRRTTHLSLVPTMLQEILNGVDRNPFSVDLRVLLLGGAASSKRLIETIHRYRIPALTSYGMTETASHVTCTSLQDPPEKIGTSGRILPLSRLKILDERGEEQPRNVRGRIAVGGDSLFAGYIGQNEVKDLFLTNDYGYLDEEGFLHVEGRIDDIISSGGEKFSASEIEEVALSSQGVKRACVVKRADRRWGERPVLFVEGEICLNQLREHLARELPRHKVPDLIKVLPEIPLTSIGKVDLPALRLLLEP